MSSINDLAYAESTESGSSTTPPTVQPMVPMPSRESESVGVNTDDGDDNEVPGKKKKKKRRL